MFFVYAEGEGFEPSIQFPRCRISSAVPSTSQPPFHILFVQIPLRDFLLTEAVHLVNILFRASQNICQGLANVLWHVLTPMQLPACRFSKPVPSTSQSSLRTIFYDLPCKYSAHNTISQYFSLQKINQANAWFIFLIRSKGNYCGLRSSTISVV